ncbi:NUDIX hydrolase [Streptomyces sp. IBSNAI002]|uniref:NUDIX hydrolase n=1 Tax=Streptomyces sp. IBSNAI002 TaxID=3457500 RepID=UPI003FCFC108
MSEQPPHAPAVEVLDADVHRLELVETVPPLLTVEQTAATNRVWEELTASRPGLFDGPAVVCAGLEQKDPHTLVLTWYRATYRRFALRLDPEHAVPAPSVFVTVAQPTDDNRLLIGRMAWATAAPGRWQLPGGTIEPPAAGAVLDMEALARHAARELAEEVGRDVRTEELELWSVTRGDKGNVGLHFRAPACPADALEVQYALLVAAETAHGRTPELDRIAFIRTAADVHGLGGPSADFLPLLAARHSGAVTPGRPSKRGKG